MSIFKPIAGEIAQKAAREAYQKTLKEAAQKTLKEAAEKTAKEAAQKAAKEATEKAAKRSLASKIGQKIIQNPKMAILAGVSVTAAGFAAARQARNNNKTGNIVEIKNQDKYVYIKISNGEPDFAAGSAFEISASNSTPSINDKYNIKKKISPTEFLLDSKTVITTPGNSAKYVYKSDYAAELGATLVDSGEILIEDIAKPFASPILNAGADLVDSALGGLENLTGWDFESIKMYGYYGFFLIIILIILYICNLTIFPAIGMLLKFNKSSTVNTTTASK